MLGKHVSLREKSQKMEADPKDDFKHRDEHLFNLNEIFQF